MTAIPPRHLWGDRVPFYNERGHHKTERACLREGCGLIRVTRHEPGASPPHWREWFRDGQRIVCEGTPKCVGVLETPAL